MRRRPRLLASGLLAVLALAGAAAAQSSNPRVAATVEADSIRIGRPFDLALRVELPSRSEVRFPAVLPLPEDLEQRGAVEIESGDDGRTWTARYSLAAWQADSIAIPAIEALVQPADAPEYAVSLSPPTVLVRSILPADEAALELRDARPFLRLRSFPWWILLLVALAASAAWLWFRWRSTTRPGLAAQGPGAIALGEFDRLRQRWRGGEIGLGQFYDAFEEALRRYVRATRNWSPSAGLAGLASGGDLLGALRRSTVVRFAHAGAPESGPDAALDAGAAFVEAEMPKPDEPDEDGEGPS